jgi:tetratricopeptide (TPR) repeat protein
MAIVTMLFAAPAAHASPESRQRTREAFGFAYELNFVEAYAAFGEAMTLDPDDPAPPRGLAAVVWIETLFTQGAATFEAFTGQVSSKSDVERPSIPRSLSERFRTHLERAMSLAERQLARSPDADAHYQVGATAALGAIHMATVEGRTFGSFGSARRAVRMMERARALNLRSRETALVLGMSRYTVSTMAAPIRMLAAIAGLSGGRAEGIALIDEAASEGADTQTDALLVLMIIDNREGKYREALGRLDRLQTRFPSNRLLPLNAGTAAIEAKQFDVAEQTLSTAMQVHDLRRPPTALGEEALWYLKRGTARAGVGRDMLAHSDLSTVLTVNPRDWVRGRAHIELGKLALKSRDRDEARGQFQQALQFAQRGGDGSAAREAKTLLAKAR